ncbi:MAG: hypothetical protein V4586_11910 [Pseudomonadota bacterium]
MKTAVVIFFLVAGIAPQVMLSIYEYRRWKNETEYRRWKNETGRHGLWSHHWDFAYKRAARRSGRAYLQILTMGWFLICWVGLSFV